MASKANPPTSGNEVTLKVVLSPDEHKLVKMAAAELEVTIAQFLHDSAVSCANVEVAKFIQRETKQATESLTEGQR